MRRIRLAIIGFGRLGRACARAMRDSHDLELAGVVTRSQAGTALAHPFGHGSVVGHMRELEGVDAALVCVPAEQVLDVAGDVGSHQSLLLEARFDVVAFAARVMLDAARRLPQLRAGAHVYSLWL